MTNKTTIIAEAGVNHNGDLNEAKKLIIAAKDVGADFVKFQSFKADELVSKKALKSPYQIKNTRKKESLYEMLKSLTLSFPDLSILKEFADKKGIKLISTPFDMRSADELEKLKVKIIKISSGDITNLPLISYVAKKKIPMIISTGRSNIKEVKEAVEAVEKMNFKEISLLHCVSYYPANFDDLNLRAIHTLKKEFNYTVGFSDHSKGIEASIAAVSLGAEIIEKHITMNCKQEGPDHSASLEPYEFKKMIESIRNIERSLGDGKKVPAESEKLGIKMVRRSLTANKNIDVGTIIKENDVGIKRPADGIAPKHFKEIIGMKVKENIGKDEPIKWENLEKN